MRFVKSQIEVIDTLRQPKMHSTMDRRRAYLFLVVYSIMLIATFLCWFHFVGAWVALFCVQLVEMIFAIMYALTINEYQEKNASAMECERTANPLVDAYVAIRIAQVVLFLWNRNYVCCLIYVAVLVGVLMGLRHGHVYVDATDLWRHAKQHETKSWAALITEVLLVVVVLMTMVFAIIVEYS